jgi:hypothetical protein
MNSTSKPAGTSMNASDLFRPATNPFLAETVTQAAERTHATAGNTGAEGYALIADGTTVDADIVENAALATVEVRIAWGDTQLHVAHLDTMRSFYVGEEQGKHISCDYFLPAEKLGTTRAPLVFVQGGVTHAVVFAGATGTVRRGGQRQTIAEAIAEGSVTPCPELAGAVMVALSAGTSVEMEHAGMRYFVASVAAGRKYAAPMLAASTLSSALMVGLSFLVHTGLLAGFAFFRPSLGGVDDAEAHQERVLLMQQLIKSSQDPEEEPELAKNEAGSEGGREGAQAAGEKGEMGKKDAAHTNLRYGKAGPRDNPDPSIAKTRSEQLAEAQSFGLIGLLDSVAPGGDSAGPTAPWGRDAALGSDERSAEGAMWGAAIGESGGQGGLGLSGMGDGGGSIYSGIGLGSIGTIGSRGTCKGADCAGIGGSTGRMQGEHKTSAPVMRPGTTTIGGTLPREVVQRVIRQNFGRYRSCYEAGLRNNPTLAGRVAVRFVIGRDGAVANVGNGGSDLPDSAVVSCVVRSFSGLSFPAPESGIVTVVYPLMFSPGQ